MKKRLLIELALARRQKWPVKLPRIVYAAAYGSVEAAMADLDAIEQLHKDEMIGSMTRR